MPSLTAYTVLLMCLLFTAYASYEKIPNDIKDFMTVACGKYDNQVQIKAGSTEHDRIQVRTEVVELRAQQFHGHATLFYEFVVNDAVVLLHICRIKHGKQGTLIMLPYNFTDNLNMYRPFEFPVAWLDTFLEGKTLVTDPAYAVYIAKQKGGSYFMSWPDSRSIIAGKNPSYTVSLTCEATSSTVPLFSNERSTSSPYVFNKTQKYGCESVFGANFESFCDKLGKQCPVLGLNLGIGLIGK